MMKELTSYTYSFEELIQGEFLYVDKTEYIWNMIRPRTAGYFLSRPRRFGKSLTVSTLKAIFQGKKELFNGLAISKKDYDWKPYPVIHLDMNGLDFSSVEELESSLCGLLKEAAVLWNLRQFYFSAQGNSAPCLCHCFSPFPGTFPELCK